MKFMFPPIKVYTFYMTIFLILMLFQLINALFLILKLKEATQHIYCSHIVLRLKHTLLCPKIFRQFKT